MPDICPWWKKNLAEFKIKNANKNYELKLKEFILCYLPNNNAKEVFIENNHYLSDLDFKNEERDSD